MLSNLRLRMKLLLLTLGPILLLSILLSGIAVYELRALAEQQEEHTRKSLIQDRRAELKHYVELARNAIGPIHERSAEGDFPKTRDDLPFGAHGWHKIDTERWRAFIDADDAALLPAARTEDAAA